MFPLKISDSVLLDYFDESDATELFSVIDANRNDLREFLPWLDFNKSAEASLAFIKKVTLENHEKEALTLCIREEGRIVGVIGFHEFDFKNNAAGIGYWLAQDAQGKGIITMACEKLLEYGFYHLKLSQISLSCNTSNAKSEAVAKRLGFSRMQFLPQNEWLYDHHVDHHCFMMSSAEWAALQLLKNRT